MSPVKIYLNENDRLKKVLHKAQLAKTVGSELVFETEVEKEVVEDEIEEVLENIEEESNNVEEEIQKNAQCLTCKVEFNDRSEQVTHYKSDYHRYNIKLRLMERTSITLEEFSNLKDDVLSISGSNSDTSDEDVDKQRHLSLYLSSSDSESESEKPDLQFNNRLPKFYLRNDKDEIICFYKKLLYSKKSEDIHKELLPLSLSLLESAHQQRWCVILFNGNHFAAAVFQGRDVLVHRTFHHYVVRAKRGTAQSVNDNSRQGNQAKSAGASLRRNNEAHQTRLIQELLTEWQDEHLSKCHLIFLRIPGYKKGVFYGGKSPIFRMSDPRLRSIPFITRRPTYNEVVRTHTELFSVTVFDRSTATRMFQRRADNEQKLRRQQEKKMKSSPRTKQKNERKRKEKKKQEAYTTPSLTQLQLDQENKEDLEMGTEAEASTENLAEFAVDPDVVNNKKNKKKQRKRNQKAKKNQQENISNKNNEEQTVPSSPPTRKSIQEKVEIFSHLPTHERELIFLLYTSCKMNDVPTTMDLLSQRRATTSRSGHDLTVDMQDVDKDQLSVLLSSAIDAQGNTLLHLVARGGSSQLIKLLLEHGSNPCVRNFESFLPYNLCCHKTGRNIFRKFRASNPHMYDYKKTDIPEPLSEEHEKEIERRQAEKKKEKRAVRKEKEKKKKEEKRAEEEEKAEKERFLLMSDREKRLLAIERRMQQQQNEIAQVSASASLTINRCYQCGASLFAKVPFTYYDFMFCSTGCLCIHRSNHT